MKVLLVQMIKNKTLISSDCRNYRPIALHTAASKMFELILQNKVSPCNYTSGGKFGFKASHGTDIAVISFKKSVKIYLNSGPPVFVCFLGATKSFDRVNHTKIFNILTTRKIPVYLIGILSY